MFKFFTGVLLSAGLIAGMTAPGYPFADDEIRFGDTRNQKPVILDMDFSTDVDDACALRVAINADVVGEISLKAVTMSVKGPDDINLKAAHGILRYQGLKNVLIGRSTCDVVDESPYWEVLSGFSDGNFEIQDAVKVWRTVIAESDRKVDIVTTGYITTLADFCKSQPDEISDMSGMEMLNERIGNIYVTGGSWPEGYDNNFFYYKETRESLDWILHNVTRPIFFISNDAGGPIPVGGKVTREYPDDPVSKALLAWGTDWGRAGWDPMVMYMCMRVDNMEQAQAEGFGLMPIEFGFDVNTGENRWHEVEESNFYRLYRINDDLVYYQNLLDDWCIIKQ